MGQGSILETSFFFLLLQKSGRPPRSLNAPRAASDWKLCGVLCVLQPAGGLPPGHGRSEEAPGEADGAQQVDLCWGALPQPLQPKDGKDPLEEDTVLLNPAENTEKTI